MSGGEIIVYCFGVATGFIIAIAGKLTEKSKQAIQAHYLSLLPKKRAQTKYIGKRSSLIQGWNNAIEETERRIQDD